MLVSKKSSAYGGRAAAHASIMRLYSNKSDFIERPADSIIENQGNPENHFNLGIICRRMCLHMRQRKSFVGI
jgi:hypothetical protein